MPRGSCPRLMPIALLCILGKSTGVLAVTDFSVLQTQLKMTHEIRFTPFATYRATNDRIRTLLVCSLEVRVMIRQLQWRNSVRDFSQHRRQCRLRSYLRTCRLEFHREFRTTPVKRPDLLQTTPTGYW